MSVCIARRIQPGDVAAQGISTPLVLAGYVLAKLTHAPDLRFASAIGQSIARIGHRSAWRARRTCGWARP